MGMIAYLLPVTAAELEEFKLAPAKLESLIAEQTQLHYSAMADRMSSLTADEKAEIQGSPEKLAEILAAKGPVARVVDIDKSWEGLLFLLTGRGLSGLGESDPGSGRALFSGQLIDPAQDLGYGPAHYLEPEEVATVSKELHAIRVEDLEARFDPAGMMRQQIYPTIWDHVDDDLKGYLLDYFDELKIVYQAAAEKGDAMITFIS